MSVVGGSLAELRDKVADGDSHTLLPVNISFSALFL